MRQLSDDLHYLIHEIADLEVAMKDAYKRLKVITSHIDKMIADDTLSEREDD